MHVSGEVACRCRPMPCAAGVSRAELPRSALRKSYRPCPASPCLFRMVRPCFLWNPGTAEPMLRQLGLDLPRPAAILAFSPHWMAREPLVGPARSPRRFTTSAASIRRCMRCAIRPMAIRRLRGASPRSFDRRDGRRCWTSSGAWTMGYGCRCASCFRRPTFLSCPWPCLGRSMSAGPFVSVRRSASWPTRGCCYLLPLFWALGTAGGLFSRGTGKAACTTPC